MGIGVANNGLQLSHDQGGASLNLLLIGITGLFHVALRHAMGTEEDMCLFNVVTGANLLGDEFSHRTHIAWMVVPAANTAQRQRLKAFVHLAKALELAEARAAGTNRKMRIKGKDNNFINAISLDISHGRFSKRVPVAHRHIACGVHPSLAQKTLELSRLLLRDSAKRRASSD